MIGEDLRSQAHENILYAKTLEQRIEDLQNDMKALNKKLDDKDLELVIQDRQCETFQMQNEETLAAFDAMRSERHHYTKLFEQHSALATER
jgi:ABC-type phosphate transport system auxiliary subunit